MNEDLKNNDIWGFGYEKVFKCQSSTIDGVHVFNNMW